MTTTDEKTQLEPCDLDEARRKYGKYSARRVVPMSFGVWLEFYNWGKRGGALSTSDRSAAGKLGAAAARRSIEERLKHGNAI